MQVSSIQRRLLTESYRPKQLGYPYGALEPHIDAETMEIHYKQHYLKYVESLNHLLKGRKRQDLEDILVNIQRLPDAIRKDVNFNGGGVDNHNIFFKNIKPGGPERPPEKLYSLIRDKFGGLTKFKTAFRDLALEIQGSGWCWLAQKDGKIDLITTENQTSPRTRGWIPLLGCDLWEHAHYLQFKNDKKSYLESFFKCVNWDDVRNRLVD